MQSFKNLDTKKLPMFHVQYGSTLELQKTPKDTYNPKSVWGYSDVSFLFKN